MALSSILLWSEQGLLGDLRYKTLDLSRLSHSWHGIAFLATTVTLRTHTTEKELHSW